MSPSLESQISSFFDDLQSHPPYLAFAGQLAGYPKIAHLLRVIARSEEIRQNLFRSRLIACSEETEDHYVCPECGLIVAGEMPEGCPVDGTPWGRFERFERIA